MATGSLIPERIILAMAENLKTTIEHCCPEDAIAMDLSRDLLLHLAYKVADLEKEQNEFEG